MTIPYVGSSKSSLAIAVLLLLATSSIAYGVCCCWWPASEDCCTLAAQPAKVACNLGLPPPTGFCVTKVAATEVYHYTISIPPLQTGGRTARWHSMHGVVCVYYNVTCYVGCGGWCCQHEDDPTGEWSCGTNNYTDSASDPCDGPPA